MKKKDTPELRLYLDHLAERLIAALADDKRLGVAEGTVLCTGPAPYRRLDCEGRALAYIRARPRKRAVRVDVTGLWRAPQRSRLLIPAAGGSASLLLRAEPDLSDAVRFLRRTVARTRQLRPEPVAPLPLPVRVA